MEHFEIVTSGIDRRNYMIQKIKNAKKYIYICSWYIDLYCICDNNKTLYDILINKCNQGVKVYILLSVISPVNVCDKKSVYYNKTHNNLHIKVLDFESNSVVNKVVFNSLNSVSCNYIPYTDCCNREFHQRYFLVDDIHAMISGCDITDETYNCLKRGKTNKKGYYWIEYGIIFRPNTEYINYCKKNFELDGKSEINSKYFIGNFHKINTDYDKLISLIRNSKESIFAENQYIYSHNNTYNNIFLEICNRIIKSVKQKEKFRFILITNDKYIDACSNKSDKLVCNINTNIFKPKLYKSLTFLYTYLLKYITLDEINKIVHIYFGNKKTFIHSKNWIFDHKTMICGTSNLWDRSYLPNKDLDMSIVLKGNKVKESEDEIINLYSNKEGNDKTNILKLNSSKLLEKTNYKHIVEYNKRDSKSTSIKILLISALSIKLLDTLPLKINLIILSIIFIVIYYFKQGIM